MENWKTFKLKDVCSKIGSGATPKGGKESYLAEGISLIRSQNILDFNFSTNGLAFIDERQANQLSNVVVEENDVLLNITGDSVARVCQVPQNILPARVNQHVAIIRTNQQKLSSEFLKYYLLNPTFKAYMLGLAASGATRNALTKGMIEEFEITAPESLTEQKAIAKILSSLDDKIDLNRRMNATLEAIARALFKAWFVDFEPVRAGLENCPSESASPEIAKLFPSEFENGVPKGWTFGTLSDIAVNSRQNINPNEIKTETAYVGLEHIPRKNIALTEWGKSDKAESTKSRFKANDILFGRLRPYFHKVVIAPIDGICSTDILVIRPKNTHHFGQTLIHFSSDEIIQYADRLSNGAKMPRTSWSDLAKFEIVIPTKQVSEEFSKFAVSIAEKIKLNISENKALEQIRDSLLPRLISGKIRVGELDGCYNAESRGELR
ncbi:MAG: restriction endonuclease subunit S [Acidobacteria bacterium]|nr:restriction endonuclease subunit S [Acidobacteriota bacterium]MCA1639834.1 restriction endonuclease subunit S [Acidobacteriota bacterium]